MHAKPCIETLGISVASSRKPKRKPVATDDFFGSNSANLRRGRQSNASERRKSPEVVQSGQTKTRPTRSTAKREEHVSDSDSDVEQVNNRDWQGRLEPEDATYVMFA